MEAQKDKIQNSFLKQGGILAAASILVRFIGLLYRIPMANIIGDEGNGIYSAAYEIYNILLIISCYGLPMAVSKMVSSRYAMGNYKGAGRIFRCTMLVGMVTGGAAACFVFFGADWLERNFYAGYTGIAIPLRILAPTIFIVAVAGVLRGFFQGYGNMLPTAVSQIIEQLVNAFVSVFAAYLLIQAFADSMRRPAWGAAGGTLGTCLGALSALFVLICVYMKYRPGRKRQEKSGIDRATDTLRGTYHLIAVTAVPIILSQTVYQLSGIVDVTVFNNVMGELGVSPQAISVAQGIYSTKYRLLVSVPIAISTAMVSSMIPSLVVSFQNKKLQTVREQTRLTIKFNMVVAFPCTTGLMALGQPVIRMLFPSSDYVTGGQMMLLGSVCIIFYALSTVTSGVLQSIERTVVPVIHSLVSLGIHILLIVVLLMRTNLGVYALVIGNVTFPLAVCVMNHMSLRKYLEYREDWKTAFLVPGAASVLIGVLAWAVYYGLNTLLGYHIPSTLIAIVAAIFAYFVLVLKMKGLNRQELESFPFGGKMIRLAEKMHLLS